MSFCTTRCSVCAVRPSSPSASRTSAALSASCIGLVALPPSGGVWSLVMFTSSGRCVLRMRADTVSTFCNVEGQFAPDVTRTRAPTHGRCPTPLQVGERGNRFARNDGRSGRPPYRNTSGLGGREPLGHSSADARAPADEQIAARAAQSKSIPPPAAGTPRQRRRQRSSVHAHLDDAFLCEIAVTSQSEMRRRRFFPGAFARASIVSSGTLARQPRGVMTLMK